MIIPQQEFRSGLTWVQMGDLVKLGGIEIAGGNVWNRELQEMEEYIGLWGLIAMAQLHGCSGQSTWELRIRKGKEKGKKKKEKARIRAGKTERKKHNDGGAYLLSALDGVPLQSEREREKLKLRNWETEIQEGRKLSTARILLYLPYNTSAKTNQTLVSNNNTDITENIL